MLLYFIDKIRLFNKRNRRHVITGLTHFFWFYPVLQAENQLLSQEVGTCHVCKHTHTHTHKEAECPFWYLSVYFSFLDFFFIKAYMCGNVGYGVMHWWWVMGTLWWVFCVLDNGVLVWVLMGGGSLLWKGNGAWNAQNACGLNGRSTPPATGHASSLVCPMGESSGPLLSVLWRRVEGHHLTKSSAVPSVSAGDQKGPTPSSNTGPDLQRLAFSAYIPHTSSFLWAWLETEGPPNWPQAAAF